MPKAESITLVKTVGFRTKDNLFYVKWGTAPVKAKAKTTATIGVSATGAKRRGRPRTDAAGAAP